MGDGITQVRLDDGTVVWARVSQPEQLDTGGGAYQDSGVGSRIADLAGGLADTVRGVVGSLRMGMAAAAPHEVTVEFGLELAAKSGQVVSLVADGEGKAAITVTLTWSERGSSERGSSERGDTPCAV
ncbi:CU044_2847 family protein [Streptomyces sp. HNM0663]|uniref:CU044_2847 family protein n=1 Tax=Streptomyces chengmaiensis TaxID=3040919 RepID=A0ABT6HEQ0_9ACTN|nr:CU044_2847 family protein [Streptomyces chengmaiensis]MDH2387236.1 CU044_2847 family protein [Streptomyces chengmaiensis]